MAISLLRARSRLITLIAGASLLMLVLLANITPAAAGPAVSTHTYFFSNASMTKLVGEIHLPCSGGTIKKGKVTPYFTSYEDPCF